MESSASDTTNNVAMKITVGLPLPGRWTSIWCCFATLWHVTARVQAATCHKGSYVVGRARSTRLLVVLVETDRRGEGDGWLKAPCRVFVWRSVEGVHGPTDGQWRPSAAT